MSNYNVELISIIIKFAESGWEVIDTASKAWLEQVETGETSKTATLELVTAIKQADKECGSCGCEFDPLYKKALLMLQTA